MTDGDITWHYAMAREKLSDGSDLFTVREVYVELNDELSWTEPVVPEGTTWAELMDTMAKMGRVSQRKILDLTLDPPALVARSEL